MKTVRYGASTALKSFVVASAGVLSQAQAQILIPGGSTAATASMGGSVSLKGGAMPAGSIVSAPVVETELH